MWGDYTRLKRGKSPPSCLIKIMNKYEKYMWDKGMKDTLVGQGILINEALRELGEAFKRVIKPEIIKVCELIQRIVG